MNHREASPESVPASESQPIWLELELPEDSRIESSGTSGVPLVKLDTPPRIKPLPTNPPLVYGLIAKVLLPRPAFGFRVEHSLPENVQLLETNPKATVVGAHLIWNLGRLDPGREIRLQIVVQPEPGARFQVNELASFEATYSQNLHFETPLIRPRLNVKVHVPESLAVDHEATFTIEVANSGNWLVQNVKAHVELPNGLTHDAAHPIAVDIGMLYPTEKRTITLTIQPTELGMHVGRVSVCGSDECKAEAEISVEVR